jgi:hypothetical protein
VHGREVPLVDADVDQLSLLLPLLVDVAAEHEPVLGMLVHRTLGRVVAHPDQAGIQPEPAPTNNGVEAGVVIDLDAAVVVAEDEGDLAVQASPQRRRPLSNALPHY